MKIWLKFLDDVTPSNCCVALPHDAMGLPAVCECYISWSYSFTIYNIWEQQTWLYWVCACLKHGMQPINVEIPVNVTI